MIPMGDWMILEEEKMASAIEVPDAYKAKSKLTFSYIVKCVGKGWWDLTKFHESPVKIGDRVLLDVPMVARFSYAGKDYIAAQARNIAFIVEDADLAKPEPAKEVVTP